MLTRESFLSEVEAFLTRANMNATAFGRLAVGDPSFIPDLRAGRAPNLRVVERVHEFIRAHDTAGPNPDQAKAS